MQFIQDVVNELRIYEKINSFFNIHPKIILLHGYRFKMKAEPTLAITLM